LASPRRARAMNARWGGAFAPMARLSQ
jgi:hypothetical protein